MPLSTLLKTGFYSLLNNPLIVKMASGDNLLTILREHFTFTAYEITKVYRDSYGYALTAISIGLATPDKKGAFLQKFLHAKITHEFANQVENNYWQPFLNTQPGVQTAISDLKQQFLEYLKQLAKHKDCLFPIDSIDEADLADLVQSQGRLALTELVLDQLQNLAPIDDILVAFFRYQELLGNAILFFFRERLRNDVRVEKTLAALQREGLLMDVRHLQTMVQTTQDHLTQAVQECTPNVVPLAQYLVDLRQAQATWQTQMAPFLQFANQFTAWRELLTYQVDQLLSGMGQLTEKLAEVHEDVKVTKGLAEEILQKLNALNNLVARQHDNLGQLSQVRSTETADQPQLSHTIMDSSDAPMPVVDTLPARAQTVEITEKNTINDEQSLPFEEDWSIPYLTEAEQPEENHSADSSETKIPEENQCPPTAIESVQVDNQPVYPEWEGICYVDKPDDPQNQMAYPDWDGITYEENTPPTKGDQVPYPEWEGIPLEDDRQEQAKN